MVAKVKYTPIGDSISPEATIIQAALALDVLARWALKEKSAKQMNNVAKGWIEMSKVLLSLESEGEEAPIPDNSPLGFTLPTNEESDVSIDGEGPDSTPGEGVSGDDD
jgi:hypothetical protein